VLAYVNANRSFYALHCIAFGLLAMVGYGVGAWLPESLVRAYRPEGLTIAQVAKVLGLATMFLNASGIFTAGRVADHLSAKGMRDAPIVVALGVAICIVLTSSVTPFMPSLSLLWVALSVAAFPFSAYTSVGSMAINQVTPNQLRAQVSAIYLFVINVLGLGVGPALIPFINDKVFHDPAKMRYSLSLVVIVGCLLAAVLLGLVRPIYREKHAAAAEWQ